MQQQFIPITITDTEDTTKTIFINTNFVQSVYQLDDDVVVVASNQCQQHVIQKDDYIIIEMTNQQQYIIPDTNIQVFMDRFKQ